jgi:hypothetical protein
MKQALNKLSTFLLGVLFCAIGLIILSALLSGCSPKITAMPARPWIEEGPDTISWLPVLGLDGKTITWVELDSLLSSKVVVDTLMIAGELVEIRDSIPCPPGLETDSIVYVTLTKMLPDRAVPVSITVMDTLWITKPCPDNLMLPVLPTIGGGWGERLIWMASVLALLAGFFRQWRKEQPTT